MAACPTSSAVFGNELFYLPPHTAENDSAHCPRSTFGGTTLSEATVDGWTVGGASQHQPVAPPGPISSNDWLGCALGHYNAGAEASDPCRALVDSWEQPKSTEAACSLWSPSDPGFWQVMGISPTNASKPEYAQVKETGTDEFKQLREE